ncbi:MAG: neutral zinc metallopeptidase [Chloroflexota bacterium]|nr:neutral zinc metallopeptidase [Chloroflexota bacterium]
MTFNPNAQLDPSQVEDVRGGGGRLGGRGGMVAGGGLGGVVIVVLYLLLGGNLSGTGSQSGGLGGLGDLVNQTVDAQGVPDNSQLASDCKTGADANQRDDCRVLGYVNSVQAYWKGAFQAQGKTYVPAKTRFFTNQTETGCGTATTQVGPFYCPADRYIYIDLGFFEALRTQFGAQGGPFAEGYVIAHEYGHHVQDLVGALGGPSGQTGAQGQSVRVELQADCYAGVWANHAVETPFLQPLTAANIADALDAASAVGDDRIQKQTQGSVNPESWTHGSSAQRQHWFSVGYQGGQATQCDTFKGPI